MSMDAEGSESPPVHNPVHGRQGFIACQVEGCQKDLTEEKPYYIKKRLCYEHMQADSVVRRGQPDQLWRFCFQCGKLQSLELFDGQYRSCRARLRQRRRPRGKRVASEDSAQQQAAQAVSKRTRTDPVELAESCSCVQGGDGEYPSPSQQQCLGLTSLHVPSDHDDATALLSNSSIQLAADTVYYTNAAAATERGLEHGQWCAPAASILGLGVVHSCFQHSSPAGVTQQPDVRDVPALTRSITGVSASQEPAVPKGTWDPLQTGSTQQSTPYAGLGFGATRMQQAKGTAHLSQVNMCAGVQSQNHSAAAQAAELARLQLQCRQLEQQLAGRVPASLCASHTGFAQEGNTVGARTASSGEFLSGMRASISGLLQPTVPALLQSQQQLQYQPVDGACTPGHGEDATCGSTETHSTPAADHRLLAELVASQYDIDLAAAAADELEALLANQLLAGAPMSRTQASPAPATSWNAACMGLSYDNNTSNNPGVEATLKATQKPAAALVQQNMLAARELQHNMLAASQGMPSTSRSSAFTWGPSPTPSRAAALNHQPLLLAGHRPQRHAVAAASSASAPNGQPEQALLGAKLESLQQQLVMLQGQIHKLTAQIR